MPTIISAKVGKKPIWKQRIPVPFSRLFMYTLPVMIVAIAAWGFWIYLLQYQKTDPVLAIDYAVQDSAHLVRRETIELEPFTTEEIVVPADTSLVTTLPSFIQTVDAKLVLTPKKNDTGEYTLLFKPSDDQGQRVVYSLKVRSEKLDEDAVIAALTETLGNKLDDYGIYIMDLLREQEITLNAARTFPPASISKLPHALLVLRDVDAGKYTLDDTFPINNALKHGTADYLSSLAHGTPVKLRTYLEHLLTQSSNTAQYHLRQFLGGSFEAVNPRTQKELGVNKFYENPHEARAIDIGVVLTKVYNDEILKPASKELFLGWLTTAAASLKDGIPKGVPTGTRVANKVGFLFGGLEGNIYSDAAIVYGAKTDYVLVILNGSAPAFPQGRLMLQELSRVVYQELN